MKILFYAAKNYSIPVIEPLVRYGEKKGRSLSFFVSRKVKADLPVSWRAFQVFEEIGAAASWKPDFVICPGNFVDFRLPGVKVQIFHGLGIEKLSHYRIRHFFDVYMTSGPAVTERFRSLQKKYGYFLVKETGWPKIDFILNYPAAGLRRKYGIRTDQKVILYAPTFSRKMESASSLLPEIPKMAAGNEVWIIKFHELMSRDVVEKFREFNNERIRLAGERDITPLMHLADVLISDTSSVVYEFMALDKPVITFRTLDRRDKGIDIRHVHECRPAVDRCLDHPGEYRESRRRHMMEVNPYLDGDTARRVDEALSEIQREGLPLARKPGNWFRKAQVLYHARYRKGYLR
ncbi:MAG TPA: hypothetical protein ENN03_11195 [bacterium]|nr:hypothetical protein [bacterium]